MYYPFNKCLFLTPIKPFSFFYVNWLNVCSVKCRKILKLAISVSMSLRWYLSFAWDWKEKIFGTLCELILSLLIQTSFRCWNWGMFVIFAWKITKQRILNSCQLILCQSSINPLVISAQKYVHKILIWLTFGDLGLLLHCSTLSWYVTFLITQICLEFVTSPQSSWIYFTSLSSQLRLNK